MAMPENGDGTGTPSLDVAFVRSPEAARSLLDPLRRQILERLGHPGSSSSVAQSLDLPRQRVNYHVRELENGGLLRHVEDRRRGNCVERVVQATAQRYVVDPGVLGTLAPSDPPLRGRAESFSSGTLLRSAAQTLRRVGELHDEALGTGRRVPAMCLEARIRFRSPREEIEFAEAMERVLREMTDRYDDPSAEGGRTFRMTVHGHPDAAPPATRAAPVPSAPRTASGPSGAGGGDAKPPSSGTTKEDAR
jgi:hypothetical protein